MDGKAVILPKIGKVVMMEELRFAGSICEATINRTVGTWFASFCIEDGLPVPPVKDGPTIGVDVGVGTLAVCSNGQQVENPKALMSAIRRLRQVDKALVKSMNVHGRTNHSNRRERLHAKRRRIHARIVQVRNDNHHKAATAIANLAGRVVETLNVSGMLRNRRLAKAIADAEMSRLPEQAGIQVRLVRCEILQGGQVVSIVEAVRSLWLAQRRFEPVGAPLEVR